MPETDRQPACSGAQRHWTVIDHGHELPIELIPKIALGIDRIAAQCLAQFLPELGDVAFDHVLVDMVVEQTIDGTEKLCLGNPPPVYTGQVFENSPLPPRQAQR